MYGEFAAAFLGVLALILGFDAFRQWRLATKASSWPTVRGRIVSAELEDGPAMGRIIPVATHRAIIKYSYDLGDREWTSQRVYFGDDVFEKGDTARDLVRAYERDRLVQVYYNPDDPRQTVLEPRTGWKQTVLRGAGALGLALLSIAAVWFASER